MSIRKKSRLLKRQRRDAEKSASHAVVILRANIFPQGIFINEMEYKTRINIHSRLSIQPTNRMLLLQQPNQMKPELSKSEVHSSLSISLSAPGPIPLAPHRDLARSIFYCVCVGVGASSLPPAGACVCLRSVHPTAAPRHCAACVCVVEQMTSDCGRRGVSKQYRGMPLGECVYIGSEEMEVPAAASIRRSLL